VTAELDWRQEGPQTWDIVVETAVGKMTLRMGGNQLEVDGIEVVVKKATMGEYPALYARMAELVAQGLSDVDLTPMVHVADALTLGRRVEVAAFDFGKAHLNF
jgi:D-galactose 1-dehydrogenase